MPSIAFLRASLALWKRRAEYRRKRVISFSRRAKAEEHEKDSPSHGTKWKLDLWRRRYDFAKRMVAKREKQIREKSQPGGALAHRAYLAAKGLVGVMEQGGNNAGPMVTKIIRANGGLGPEAWCGDFMAYVYRLAGSKAVTRAWAAVRLLSGVTGLKITGKPVMGDLVRFTFDHVGMFVKDLGGGYILTIEGNTGASGAVSDSRTGGDGVYVKRRPKSLVHDYIHVTR